MAKKVLILSGGSFDSIVYLDSFPDPVPQTIHQSVFNETPGSTGVGKASNLGYLDFDTHLQILIGNDPFGDRIKQFLAKKPVNTLFDLDPAGTERHVNIMNQKGQRISIFVNSSSPNPAIDYSKYESLIKEADIVILNIIDYARNFIPLLKKYNKEVWTDLHDYNDDNPYHEDFIEASDYIFLSSDNLPDYKTTMQKLMTRGKKLTVCTHGKLGASLLNNAGEWYHSPCIADYDVIDTNGAGDAFFSGYLYAHCKGLEEKECLKYGHILGGMCVNSSDIAATGLSVKIVEEQYMKHFK
jgi:sugar/nucleoside kinase (ribokinase family)